MEGAVIKSFMGLSSESDVVMRLDAIKRKAQNEMSEKLKAYHLKYIENEKASEQSFEYENLQTISINIWDDFYDDGFVPDGEIQSTYAYVESSDVPGAESYKILTNFIDFISNNNLLPDSVDVSISFHDSSHDYASLVMEHEYTLYKRWQINFKGITHAALDELVAQSKSFDKFNDVPVDIYSES